MEKKPLPIKLSKEPLIDAVFELRFSSDLPASNVLPGIMFSTLKGVSSIETLPAAQLPQQVRAMEPQLRFAALTRVQWKDFLVLFGDNVLAVACRLPYPGWRVFKAGIVEVLSIFESAGFVTSMDRWSLKYTDIFDVAAGAAPLKQFDMDMRLGDQVLTNQNLQLKVEVTRDGFTHGVQVVTSATVQLFDGTSRTGTLLEVDTIRDGSPTPIAEFLSGFPRFAEEIHDANKALFFECLSDEGLNNLGPEYA